MTPNRVYKKLCKSLHTRNASQGIPDGGHLFLFLSDSFLLPSSFTFLYWFSFASYYEFLTLLGSSFIFLVPYAKRILASSCFSVCPSVWNRSAANGRVFMKFCEILYLSVFRK